MVSAGTAWWYRPYAREQAPKDRGKYKAAELAAQAQREGLWADPGPVPSWEWRHHEN